MREPKKHIFIKEIRLMLYAFGDTNSPSMDTSITVHNYLISYLTTLLIKTHNMAKLKGKTKTEDILFFLKKDRKKYTRVRNLLHANEELTKTRKIIEKNEFEDKSEREENSTVGTNQNHSQAGNSGNELEDFDNEI